MTADVTPPSREQAAADFNNNFANVFGEGKMMKFCNLWWDVRFLDMNDLIEATKKFNGLSGLANADITEVRYLLYLVLRKSDPRLSDEEIKAGKWAITEDWVGHLVTSPSLSTKETKAFLKYAMEGTGLEETEDEKEESEKKD